MELIVNVNSYVCNKVGCIGLIFCTTDWTPRHQQAETENGVLLQTGPATHSSLHPRRCFESSGVTLGLHKSSTRHGDLQRELLAQGAPAGEPMQKQTGWATWGEVLPWFRDPPV